jgi:hypothetical protein
MAGIFRAKKAGYPLDLEVLGICDNFLIRAVSDDWGFS